MNIVWGPPKVSRSITPAGFAHRTFDKAVWRWPPVVAADAGPMEIQWWEERALKRAEAGPRSMY